MFKQPRFKYYIHSGPRSLYRLETLVPGCLVYGRYATQRGRLEHLMGDGNVEIEILAPVHGAWLVEQWLTHFGVSSYADQIGPAIDTWASVPKGDRAAEGRRLVESNPEIRSHVPDLATNYQLANVQWASTRPWVLNLWACGSGKTLGSLLASLTTPGPVLVVCPAKARHVWWSQVQEYTHIKPYRIRPVSEQRKGHVPLDQYLMECTQEGTRPFVIIGSESLADNFETVQLVSPTVLIFDEIHTHGSAKRWTAVEQLDGEVKFKKRKTSGGNRHTRSVAAMDASRLSSVRLRIGLTATPLDDGRPRRLWSQLDLLVPGGFSHSYRRFAERFCDARPSPWGGIDDKGSSNLEELRARCSFFTHEVPYSESHSELPATRVQVMYLSHTELNRAGRFSDDQTFGQAMKAMAKQKGLAKERMVESRLAEACSRKRRFVIEEVLEGLQGGGKVVVFTARRRETEVWAHELKKKVGRGDETAGMNAPVWMAHGGVPESERDNIIEKFRQSDGPCCLVATGQSVGTGVDGMQTSDLAIFAMLPWKPGDFVQWKGRFDRLGGRATLLKVVVAQGTYDERVVEILTDKFGPIETFLAADELKGLDTKLLGIEDEQSLIDDFLASLN